MALKALVAAVFVVFSLAMPAAAQDWPNRPITLVVPFAAGGGIDTSARVQALALTEILGQAGCRRNDRQRPRRKGGARWIHVPDRQFRHACLQPIPVCEAAL
jgi:hypothetical protein